MKSISATTKLYGIIGSPVRHSLSPVMHNAAFDELAIDAVYLAFETKNAKAALDAMRSLGIRGYSVTIPNKQAVMKYLDEIDETAQKIGACNTIKNDNGKLIGINTDWLGAILPLEKHMKLKDKHAVILGAGGSSRAIVYGLVKKGARVSVCNRTKDKAISLCEEFKCSAYGLDEAKKLSGDILINATSVGMTPNPEKSPVDKDVIKNFDLIMDIVYSPLETRFLQMAKVLNKTIINGLEMLLFQAVAQFEFWTGQKAPIDIMKEALEKNVRT